MPRSRWDELPPPVRRGILVLSFVPPLSSVVLGGPILLLFLQERSVGLAMAFCVWLAATFIVTLYLMLRLLDDLESLPEARMPEELRLERHRTWRALLYVVPLVPLYLGGIYLIVFGLASYHDSSTDAAILTNVLLLVVIVGLPLGYYRIVKRLERRRGPSPAEGKPR